MTVKTPTPPSTGRTRPPRVRAPKLSVSVVQRHIDEAVPRNSSHCMIAEAIREQVIGAASISVDLQTIRFSDPAKRLRYIYLTPRSAQQALVDWDDGIKPRPFTIGLAGGSVVSMQARNPVRNGGPSPTATLLPPRGGSVPEVNGGSEPPVTRFSQVRSFGMRGFQRVGENDE